MQQMSIESIAAVCVQSGHFCGRPSSEKMKPKCDIKVKKNQSQNWHRPQRVQHKAPWVWQVCLIHLGTRSWILTVNWNAAINVTRMLHWSYLKLRIKLSAAGLSCNFLCHISSMAHRNFCTPLDPNVVMSFLKDLLLHNNSKMHEFGNSCFTNPDLWLWLLTSWDPRGAALCVNQVSYGTFHFPCFLCTNKKAYFLPYREKSSQKWTILTKSRRSKGFFFCPFSLEVSLKCSSEDIIRLAKVIENFLSFFSDLRSKVSSPWVPQQNKM